MARPSNTLLSDQLRGVAAPTSPEPLDQRILEYSRANTPEKKARFNHSQWLPAAATMSVMVVAVLLVVQPPIPFQQDQLPGIVPPEFPVSKKIALKPRELQPQLEQPHQQPQQQEPLSSDVVSDDLYSSKLHAASAERVIAVESDMQESLEDAQSLVLASSPKGADANGAAESAPVDSPRRNINATKKSKTRTQREYEHKTLLSELNQVSSLKSSPSALEDSDNDGMPNNWELKFELEFNNPDDADIDIDKDGLSNFEEYKLKTNPRQKDTDNDLIPDGWEHQNALDPRVNDADGDVDDDGINNLQEYYQSLKSQ
jgi:hypothetical protein